MIPLCTFHHPDIFMNDTPIAEVPNHKNLGLNISKDGTHHIHVLDLMRSGKRFQERMVARKKYFVYKLVRVLIGGITEEFLVL
jgi:hypothetical protein